MTGDRRDGFVSICETLYTGATDLPRRIILLHARTSPLEGNLYDLVLHIINPSQDSLR